MRTRAIGRAPLRIDFSGGGSDCPPFSAEYGGAVLNACTSLHAYVEAADDADLPVGRPALDRPPGSVVDGPSGASGPGGCADILTAAAARIAPGRQLRLRAWCDGPRGGGLGSSSAIAVAAVTALDHLTGGQAGAAELGGLACLIERGDCGHAGGRQDQYAAAFGGFNFMRFTDADVMVEPLAMSNALVQELERNLLLIYTGATRVSDSIIRGIQSRYYTDGDEVRRTMSRLRAAAEEQRQAFLRLDLPGFLGLMEETWSQFSRLHPSISDAAYVRFFDAAAAAGAAGAKCCGAGGGGCMVCYCPPGTRAKVRDSLSALGGREIRFTFEPRGAGASSERWRANRPTS